MVLPVECAAVGDEDDDECAVCSAEELAAVAVSASRPLRNMIVAAYESDAACTEIIKYLQNPSDSARRRLSTRTRSRVGRHGLDGDLLTYQVDRDDLPRIVVPLDDDLRARLIHEFHDSPSSGHLGREKTVAVLSRHFYWPHMYKWVRKWVRSCEACQRVKPSHSKQAPLRPLEVATAPWSSVSMDFVFGLPRDAQGRTSILVFVDRFSKMVHLAPTVPTVTAKQTAAIFLDIVYRHHGLPSSIISDCDPRFTAAFWRERFLLLGTRLKMSTASHPETDGQTERANRVVEDVLRSFATSFQSWSSFLPMVEFAINNAIHASTGFTPFFINYGRHPRVPALLWMERSIPYADPVDDAGPTLTNALTRRVSRTAQQGMQTRAAARAAPSTVAELTSRTLINPRQLRRAVELQPSPDSAPAAESLPANFDPNPEPQPRDTAAAQAFIDQRDSIIRYVRDAIAAAVDHQKEYADQHGRKNMERFNVGDRVLLSTTGITPTSVTNLGTNKLAPRFIGPFKILKVLGDAYTLQLPTAIRLHPTFYVGRLRRYHPAIIPSDAVNPPRPRTSALSARRSVPASDCASPGSPAPVPPRAEQDATTPRRPPTKRRSSISTRRPGSSRGYSGKCSPYR